MPNTISLSSHISLYLRQSLLKKWKHLVATFKCLNQSWGAYFHYYENLASPQIIDCFCVPRSYPQSFFHIDPLRLAYSRLCSNKYISNICFGIYSLFMGTNREDIDMVQYSPESWLKFTFFKIKKIVFSRIVSVSTWPTFQWAHHRTMLLTSFKCLMTEFLLNLTMVMIWRTGPNTGLTLLQRLTFLA